MHCAAFCCWMAIKATENEFESEYSRVARQYASAKAQKSHETEVEETNRQKGLQFKATHAILTSFLLWILYVVLNPESTNLTCSF